MAAIQTSTQAWIPYPTAENPLPWPDLPEWDSVLISNIQIPIAGIPEYAIGLSKDKKRGPGQNNQRITQKGLKPHQIKITLMLWVDVSGANYLDLYRTLVPILIPTREDRRFAFPVYHPVLQSFGVTSIVFTKCHTPQHVGGLVFHADIEGDNAADVKNGTSTDELPKPDPNALGGTPILTGSTFQGQPNSIVIPEHTSNGQAVAKAWGTILNTPASRSGAP
jgi:hypothetical protein